MDIQKALKNLISMLVEGRFFFQFLSIIILEDIPRKVSLRELKIQKVVLTSCMNSQKFLIKF